MTFGSAPVRMIGQNIGEALDFIGRQKPIARDFGENVRSRRRDCLRASSRGSRD
jgi:hypothetical protein